jgi:transposase
VELGPNGHCSARGRLINHGANRAVTLVLDNYTTHKTPEVRAWLSSHPRFKLHFTPTSASWLNLVERFFAEITAKRIRRGSYSSVDDLESAIYDYLLHHNAKPKPFVWSKTADDILARERRVLDALDQIRGNRWQMSDSKY